MASQRKRPLITAAKPSRLSNFHVRRNLLRRIGRELRHRIDFELGKLRHRMDSPSMEGVIRVIRKSSFGQMTINDLLKDQEPFLVRSSNFWLETSGVLKDQEPLLLPMHNRESPSSIHNREPLLPIHNREPLLSMPMQPTQPISQSIQQPMLQSISQSIQQPMLQSISQSIQQPMLQSMSQSIQEPMLQSISQSIYPMAKVKVEEEEEPQPIVKVEEEEKESVPQSMYPMVKVEEEEKEETKPVLDSLEDVLTSLTNAGFSGDLPVDLASFDFNDLMELSFTI